MSLFQENLIFPLSSTEFDARFQPDSPIPEDSPCASCVGACCRKDIIQPLSKAEARWHEAAGTELYELSRDEYEGNDPGRNSLFSRRKFYRLVTDCAMLDQETYACKAINDPARPVECSAFNAGNKSCPTMKGHFLREMIETAGVELPAAA